MTKVVVVSEVTNGAEQIIAYSEPYTVRVQLEGSADILFHRWNPESVDEKSKASKNSKAKKTDDVDSYVYRDDKGFICIPGEYLRGSIIQAAKFRQDPRSPRKSAMDLYRAAIVVATPLASLGTKNWSYLDKRRANIQRQGINRTRPAMKVGWTATFDLMCLLPEYVDPISLRETIESAGRLIGLADFRPTYGRYGITSYKVL